MMFTIKQKEFISGANKTWNLKIGATRSGKTYLDFKYRIPAKTRELKSKEGIFVVMGVSQSTVERNILEPMRKIYGDSLVGFIQQGKSTVNLFGETYHVVGHEKSNAINRIQGASIKYCYIDEIVRMNEATFEMLKSRLDQDYSCCDATGNPEQPSHFIKKFIDEQEKEGDMFYQHYTIDDNPNLPESFVERLKREYAGTVYYKRYILGMWALAEGAIYSMFRRKHHVIKSKDWNEVDAEGRYIHPIRKLGGYVNIGVDFGGNKSAHAFNATFITRNNQYIATVMDFNSKDKYTPKQLDDEFVRFVKEVMDIYILNEIRADSADPVLIRGLQNALYEANINYKIKNAIKGEIMERVRTYQRLINSDRFYIVDTCEKTIEAFENAVYNEKTEFGVDKRLDDGTTNIDNLDAQEYSTERLHKALLKE